MSINHLTDEELQAYLDSDLSENRDAILSHINKCNHCQLQLAAYQRVFDEVSLKPEEMFSLDFDDNILRKIKTKELKKLRLKNYMLRSLTLISGSIIMIYYLFKFRIIDVVIQSIIVNIIGNKKILMFSVNLIEKLDINLVTIISAIVALLIFGLFDKILLFSKYKKVMASN